MGCSLPGSSVHGISQARILEWVAISFSRGSSQPRNQIRVSCIGRRILYHYATWEAPLHVFRILIICCICVLKIIISVSFSLPLFSLVIQKALTFIQSTLSFFSHDFCVFFFVFLINPSLPWNNKITLL